MLHAQEEVWCTVLKNGITEHVTKHFNFLYNLFSCNLMDNSTFERVEEFKYLGTTLTNQNAIQEEIKSRW